MKSWKKPLATMVTVNELTDLIKTYAFTCLNGYLR